MAADGHFGCPKWP